MTAVRAGLGWLSAECSGNLALEGCQGVPAEMPRGMPAAACRWRAGLSHLLSPRKPHVYEREGENVQFYTSLPRPFSSTKTIFLPYPPSSKESLALKRENVEA